MQVSVKSNQNASVRFHHIYIYIRTHTRTHTHIYIHISPLPKSFTFKMTNPWSSHCGTAGSVAFGEHWNAGLIPGPVQCVKDPVLPHLWLSHSCASDLIPGPGTPYAEGWPKKKKKKSKIKGLKITNPLFFYRMCPLPTLGC